MNFLYKFGIFKISINEEKEINYFNWPRLIHILGLGALSTYYLNNLSKLLYINPLKIFSIIGINVGICSIYVICSKFIINKPSPIIIDNTGKTIIGKHIVEEYSKSTLPILFVAGEEALFIVNFIYNNQYLKFLTSIIFAGLHYIGGAYSFSSCFIKFFETFLTLSLDISLINRIIAHVLQDYLLVKFTILAYKYKSN